MSARRKVIRSVFTITLFCLSVGGIHAAEIIVTTTIQEAVNTASSGDTILVPRGIYRENVVVNKSGLTIVGNRNAILDGEGLSGTIGIRVAPPTPTTRLNGFRLEGLTIKNYALHGVFLARVDNYQIVGGIYEDNEEYGIFPVRSTNGLVEQNQTSGSEDSGIYIGQSDSIIIRRNVCFDNTTGIEIENSTHVEASDNLVKNNSAGISVFALPGLSIPAVEDVLLEGNTIFQNNRQNLIADPTEILSRLPAGTGILIIAGDRVEVTNNRVLNNDTTGIAVVRLPPDLAALDPRVDPFPDMNLITNNVVLRNGTNPDPRALLPPADLDWDLTGTGNHWENNRYQTSFPVPLP